MLGVSDGRDVGLAVVGPGLGATEGSVVEEVGDSVITDAELGSSVEDVGASVTTGARVGSFEGELVGDPVTGAKVGGTESSGRVGDAVSSGGGATVGESGNLMLNCSLTLSQMYTTVL